MPDRSSPDALDAELTRRVEEQARILDALVAVEGHPGHRLLAAASLPGVTAVRWAATQELLASVHADLAAHRAVVADACAVRTRRRRPGGREWAELHALLTATAPGTTLTLGELTDRMDAGVGDLADGLGGDLDRIEDRLAELTTARAGWTDRYRAVAGAVAALDPLWERADRARHAALDRVTGPAAVPPDPRPALRRRLGALPTVRPGADALAALPGLERDVLAAGDALRSAATLATELVDRRAELAGRFAAYRAKALRVGVSDDPRVVALAAEIRRLLDGPRTDLAALTRALVAYQDRITGERTA